MKSVNAAAIAAGIGLAFASAVADAQTRPQPVEGALFVSPMGEPFRSADRANPPIQMWFSRADSDADDRLSREEFVTQAMSFFADTLDANRDGAATSSESTQLWRERAPEMLAARTAPVALPTQQRRQPNDMGGRGPRDRPDGFQSRETRDRAEAPSGSRPFQLVTEIEPVMSCDADFSRRVDAAEFERCATRRFAVLDVNGDGTFTLEESERAGELMEPPRRERP